jgi:hypothetical protein
LIYSHVVKLLLRQLLIYAVLNEIAYIELPVNFPMMYFDAFFLNIPAIILWIQNVPYLIVEIFKDREDFYERVLCYWLLTDFSQSLELSHNEWEIVDFMQKFCNIDLKSVP